MRTLVERQQDIIDKYLLEANKRLSKDMKDKLEKAITQLMISKYSQEWTGNEAEIIIQYMWDESPEFPKMSNAEKQIASNWIRKTY